MASIKYRKNVNCLTSDELHDLREAYAGMYALPASNYHSYEMIAGLHGGPSPTYCEHGYPGFLTWHRAYLLTFEEALQRVHCDVTLPFWDWSSKATVGLPSAVSSPTYVNRSGVTVPNPLYSGPIPASVSSAGTTSRSPSVGSRDFGPYAAQAQAALLNSDFDDFQVDLNGPHGSVHGAVGGHMGGVWTAGFDPIFWMHHANVDRIWADWQKLHPGPMPASENALELEPFTHGIGTNYKTGAEMLSTEALGYRYTRWCRFKLPWPYPWPLSVRKIVPFPPPWRVKLVFEADKMPQATAEVRVFINDADVRHDTPISRTSFAGTLGFFGGTAPDGKAMLMAPRGKRQFAQSLQLGGALERLGEGDAMDLRVVAVSPEGTPVDLDRLGVKGLELLVEH